MKRNRMLELATYIVVPLLGGVVTPLLAKYLDSLYFHYPNVLSDSISLLTLGSLMIVCGMALALWTIFLFKTIGQGTPNPMLPPKVFVVSGPYRVSRNPMALGGLLILLGQAAMYYSPSLLGLAVLFGVIFYFYVVLVEEPELIRRFGQPYIDYLARVPRFVPNPWKRHE